MNTAEAHDYLIKNGVDVDIQTVRKWLRTGVLKGELISKRIGYQIDKESLDKQIQKKLSRDLKGTEEYKIGYNDGFEAAQQLYYTDQLTKIEQKMDLMIQQTKNTEK